MKPNRSTWSLNAQSKSNNYQGTDLYRVGRLALIRRLHRTDQGLQVIVPQPTKQDLDDMPLEVREEIDFVFAARIEDVLSPAIHPVQGTKP